MERKNYFNIVVTVCLGVLVWSTAGFAFQNDFHGYLESRFVLRDTNGFQDGFMDDSEGVQWIQELQLDMEVRPEYVQGVPAVRFDKAFFRYRGAYDAIYDVSNEYDGIMDTSPSRFEPGKKDLRLDQDLRECFADLVAENQYGTMRGNLRLGKQIVQWGDADVFNLMNIVNPSDYYNKAFFSNPEDLAAPLWMARFDASVPGVGMVNNFNFQLLAIPEFRPHTFGPLGAPYELGLPYVETAKSSWGGDNWEFGGRVGAVLPSSSFYLYYFDGKQDGPAMDFSTLYDPAAGYVTLRHPDTRSYGYSFSHFVEAGNFVFRGEGSVTEDKPLVDFGEPTGMGYTLHDWYQVMVGFDKSFSNVPIGTDSALTTALQFYYAKIDDWDENEALGRTTPEEDWRITLLFATDYYHGSISPNIFFLYDSEDALLVNGGVTYSPDAKWYFTVSAAGVFGDEDGHGDYNPYIETNGELILKIGYRW